MEIYIPKRRVLISLLVLLTAAGSVLVLLKKSGRSLAQTVGFDSGRGATLAGTKAFYSVDYHDSQDVWASRLCALSHSGGAC